MVETGYKVTEVAKGLDHPYSIAFLPDGSMLVTERKGQLRLIKDGQLALPTPITGVPPVHLGGVRPGLFDVVLHPKFAENSLVYLTYAHGTATANMTRVARARFDGSALAGSAGDLRGEAAEGYEQPLRRAHWCFCRTGRSRCWSATGSSIASRRRISARISARSFA